MNKIFTYGIYALIAIVLGGVLYLGIDSAANSISGKQTAETVKPTKKIVRQRIEAKQDSIILEQKMQQLLYKQTVQLEARLTELDASLKSNSAVIQQLKRQQNEVLNHTPSHTDLQRVQFFADRYGTTSAEMGGQSHSRT